MTIDASFFEASVEKAFFKPDGVVAACGGLKILAATVISVVVASLPLNLEKYLRHKKCSNFASCKVYGVSLEFQLHYPG